MTAPPFDHDITEQLARMARMLLRIAYPARNTPDESADVNMFAEEIQATWSRNYLESVIDNEPPTK